VVSAVNYQTVPPVTRPSTPAVTKSASWSRARWKAVASLSAFLVLGTAVYLLQERNPASFGKVLILDNVDANVAGNGFDLVRGQVTQSTVHLADAGGGSLDVVEASGGPAQVVASADLRVEREGQIERDSAVRDREVSKRVEHAFEAAAAVPLRVRGRNLVSLFQEAHDLRPSPGQTFDMFYIGLGLATVDPADARVQMAGDPEQAVRALAPQLPRLSGATLHVIYPAAAGPQPAPNPLTSAWRKEYWVQLAKAMDASLVSVDERNIPAPVAAGAPAAPVIRNLADPTKVPPGGKRPIPNPPTPGAPVVLAGTTYMPDSARLVDPAEARLQLRPLATTWMTHPGAYVRVDCFGRTAAIGPDATAVILSQQRADQAASILHSLGIAAVHTKGLGFRQPLPGIPSTDPRQRNVTCALVPK
jgi:outer membrane protein OmpA-like peptidoglycan-associated protein